MKRQQPSTPRPGPVAHSRPLARPSAGLSQGKIPLAVSQPSQVPGQGGEGVGKWPTLPPWIDPKLAGVVLFTKPQMAAMLQISVRTLCTMMKRGEVSYLRLNERLVRFRIEDVLRRLTEVGLVRKSNDGREGA